MNNFVNVLCFWSCMYKIIASIFYSNQSNDDSRFKYKNIQEARSEKYLEENREEIVNSSLWKPSSAKKF